MIAIRSALRILCLRLTFVLTGFFEAEPINYTACLRSLRLRIRPLNMFLDRSLRLQIRAIDVCLMRTYSCAAWNTNRQAMSMTTTIPERNATVFGGYTFLWFCSFLVSFYYSSAVLLLYSGAPLAAASMFLVIGQP